jgi:hypothetical protein
VAVPTACEAAEDDPGPEQAGRDRQDQDLEQAPLNEGKLEGVEQGVHEPDSNENESNLYLAPVKRISATKLRLLRVIQIITQHVFD